MSLPTGIIVGEDIRAYHGSDCVSHSKLKTFGHSPSLYFRQYVAKTYKPERETSEAMTLGSALGNMLEGGLACLQRDFVVNTDFEDFRSTAAKEWKAKAIASGRTVLSKDQLKTVLSMVEAVDGHFDAKALMGLGQPEVTFRLKLEHFHIQARCDRWHEDALTLSDGQHAGPIIAELKTTASLLTDGWNNFTKSFHDFGYYRQAGLYREVVATVLNLETLPELLYVVVENCEPFRCAVFRPDPTALNLAREEVRRQLRSLRDCYATGIWADAITSGIQPLALPSWFMRSHLAALDTPPLLK